MTDWILLWKGWQGTFAYRTCTPNTKKDAWIALEWSMCVMSANHSPQTHIPRLMSGLAAEHLKTPKVIFSRIEVLSQGHHPDLNLSNWLYANWQRLKRFTESCHREPQKMTSRKDAMWLDDGVMAFFCSLSINRIGSLDGCRPVGFMLVLAEWMRSMMTRYEPAKAIFKYFSL